MLGSIVENKDRETLLIISGVIMIVISFYILYSPVFNSKVSDFSSAVKVRSSVKYNALQQIKSSVTSLVKITDNRFYALISDNSFVTAVSPQLISINSKLIPLQNPKVYVDNLFLKTGVGNGVIVAGTPDGNVEILVKLQLNGMDVTVTPVFGVLDNGKEVLYLVHIVGSGFTFTSYSSLNPQISQYFTPDGKLIDPVSLRPIDINQ